MSQVITHRPSSDAAQIPTVVLYDVMREAANRLRGELVHLEREHPEDAGKYRQARFDVSDRADAVDARDRRAITAADAAFRAELAQLHAA